MPIPKPESGESEEKYIGRCISEIASEYDSEGKATYDKDKMSKITDTMSKVMARVAFDTKFKGINLQAAGIEDACWPGYEAIGTKDMDGREVPNCVPIKEEQIVNTTETRLLDLELKVEHLQRDIDELRDILISLSWTINELNKKLESGKG